MDGVHCMAPAYIKASVAQSLERMGLATLDLLYIHNAAESQLPALGYDVFMARLQAALTACEELRREGKIRWYGLATWSCFRQPPPALTTEPSSDYYALPSSLYLSLAEVVAAAERAAGGAHHGFRFIQVSLIVMPCPPCPPCPTCCIAGSSFRTL